MENNLSVHGPPRTYAEQNSTYNIIVAGCKEAALTAATIVYDLKEIAANPRSVGLINSIFSAIIMSLEFAEEQMAAAGKEIIDITWNVTFKDTIKSINGFISVFKIFNSVNDCKTFASQTIWKQLKVIAKFGDNLCSSAEALVVLTLPHLGKSALTFGRTALGPVTLSVVKNWFKSFACIFSILDALTVIQDMKKHGQKKRSMVSLACDIAKLAVIILSGSLGVAVVATTSQAFLLTFTTWVATQTIKTVYDIHNNRAKALTAAGTTHQHR